jgi:hypothetical protein
MLLIATLAPVAILASAQSNQQPQPQQFDVQESFATPVGPLDDSHKLLAKY